MAVERMPKPNTSSDAALNAHGRVGKWWQIEFAGSQVYTELANEREGRITHSCSPKAQSLHRRDVPMLSAEQSSIFLFWAVVEYTAFPPGRNLAWFPHKLPVNCP